MPVKVTAGLVSRMAARRLLVVGLCLAWLAPAAAQPPATVAYPQASQAESPDAALARQLTILANNPSSVPALTAAGKSALELGDPQAALTFFGRADELSPNDPAIKAGLGSSLVLLEEARGALRTFEEAVRLGAPEAEIAADRGLAFDLIGDNGRAQRDYLLSLRRRDDPEIRRRLALSQAIAGDRNAALSTIDDQIRRQDPAAWRTRAFILALTGDAAGATRAVQAVMPRQAAAMEPFLAKLPSLALSDRALAVNFGHFPGQAQPVQTASALPPVPEQPALASAAGEPARVQKPSGYASAGNAAASVALPKRREPVPSLQPPAMTAPARPVQTISLAPGHSAANGVRAGQGAVSLPVAPPPTVTASEAPAKAAPTKHFADVAALVASLSPALDQSAEPPAAKPKSAPTRLASAAPARDTTKADAKASAAKKKADATADAKAAAVKKQEAAKAKEPSRVWVQLGHASTTKALPDIYGRVKGKAPKLFAGKSAWISASKITNRLLVGPFGSEKEAKAFVDKLDKSDVEALSWTSPAGQEIRKLSSK